MDANFLGGRDDVGGMGSSKSDAAVLGESVARPVRFACLYERHLAAVAVYLARRVGPELAEDLTAEVFVRAFRGRADYRAEYATALPWLLGIANHLVADHRRAERRRLTALQRMPIATMSVSDLADPLGLTASLVRMLRRLPAADRDTLLLMVWGELSYEETASAVGVPVGTVRSRIARARRRLSDAINAESVDPVARSPSLPADGDAHA